MDGAPAQVSKSDERTFQMATDLKIPIDVRHEFLRRLHCTGLSDESIDAVINQMWYRFGVGEFTEKRHSEIREALETSNPLSQRCHAKMKEYWEDLPRLPNGLILAPTDECKLRWEQYDAQMDRNICLILSRLENVEDTTGADPIVNDYVITLVKQLLRFKKLALKGLEVYLNRLDAQENAVSDSDPDGLKRLLVLLGDDVSPPDRDDSTSEANEGAIPEKPAIRV